MPNALSNTVGNLIDNVAPLPDGTVQTPFVNVVAFTGTTQATALALTQEITVVTNNTAAHGGILPIGLKGQRMEVYPSLITNAPLVYPPLGGTINNGAVNAGRAAPARLLTVYRCIDDTGLNWIASA